MGCNDDLMEMLFVQNEEWVVCYSDRAAYMIKNTVYSTCFLQFGDNVIWKSYMKLYTASSHLSQLSALLSLLVRDSHAYVHTLSLPTAIIYHTTQ